MKKHHPEQWFMLVLLCLGAGFRIIGMNWGLPYQLHPDEPVLFINAWARWLDAPVTLQADYPPLYPILLAWQRAAIYQISGTETPQVVYFFIGRYTSVLTSLLIIVAAYWMGRVFGNRRTGLTLAAFFTFDPISVTDQGWIIKADNLAWLMGFICLGLSLLALKKRPWLAGAILALMLAILAKYTMIFLALSILYVILVWLIKREWLVALLFIVGVPLGLLGFRAFLIAHWQSEIDPIFVYCSGDSKEHLESHGVSTDKAIEWLPCEPYLAFQRFGANFYQYNYLWRDRANATLQTLNREIRSYYTDWQLFLGAGLILWVYLKPREKRLSLLPLALAFPIYATFIMLASAQHDRQYYMLFMSLNLALAGALGHIQKPWLYAATLFLFLAPNFAKDADFRHDLLKPDTRAETANWMLNHARRGETLLVEYDHVEFQNQYGGFPESDGYFNVIGLEGLWERQPDELFEQGIFYVVTDFRATRSPQGAFGADLRPYGFDLVYDLSNPALFFGPARQIYRTFRPQTKETAHFGDVLRLEGYDLQNTPQGLDLQFYWHVQATNLPDLSLFVHLQDTQTGQILWQQDAPPDRPSRFWEPYEWVFDTRQLDFSGLRSGNYRLLIGWYDPISGVRLALNGDATGIFELFDFEWPQTQN